MIGFGLFSLLLITAGAGALRDLFAFAGANDTASHILLVPFVTLMLLYQDRDTIFAVVRPAIRAGVIVVAVGGAILLAGSLLAAPAHTVLTVRVTGLVVAWIGGFLLFFGVRAGRAALFPLVFLGFFIPIPTPIVDGATGWLKAGSVHATASLFSLTGTPYFREGFVFALPDLVIEVADECSGIRSSIGLLLTSLLAGHTFLNRTWAKGILVLAILPLAILKNAIRIVTLTLLAMHVDRGFLDGRLHHEGGIVFFGVALVILALVLFMLRRYESARPAVVRVS